MSAIKPVSIWALFGLIFALVSVHVFSLSAQDVKFAAKEPALLTTAGQSADLNMAKVILDRSKVSLKLAPLAYCLGQVIPIQPLWAILREMAWLLPSASPPLLATNVPALSSDCRKSWTS